MRNTSRILLALALSIGMAVTSWGFAAPHPLPAGSESGAYLGVMVDKVSPETAAALHITNGGTLIANVDQDGPACHAGLKGGDIVTAFNGKAVSGPEQFADLIHASAPGSTVTMTVVRNGKSQDMKVKLGDWKQMAAMPPAPAGPPLSPVGTMPPMPPMPAYDVPGFSPLLSHSGILVEPLSPQLGEFFAAPPNQGVLVRSVDKGSPGAAAGLKAGDVVVKVNNETIHDMVDWKRALRTQGGKLTLSIVRDKKPQTLQMSLPGNTSKLEEENWNDFGPDMQAFADEMARMQPEIERNAREWAQMATLDPKRVEEIRRQADDAARSLTPEIKKQAEEMSKQAEQMAKDMAKMTPELERQAREMAESMKPTAKELNDMTREIQLQMKNLQPEIQKQMEEFRKQWQEQQPQFQKQMEQLQKQMQEWQKNFQESFPKEM
jgi:serine protease Do